MVEQPSHGDALLVATTQRIPPFPRNVPTTFPLDDVIDVKQLQDPEQIIVRDPSLGHSLTRVRVDDLVAECSEGQVWSLRNICELARRGFRDRATIDRPQATKNSEQA